MYNFQKLKSIFFYNIDKHFIDCPLILKRKAGGVCPFADVWNKDQDRQLNASLKDKV